MRRVDSITKTVDKVVKKVYSEQTGDVSFPLLWADFYADTLQSDSYLDQPIPISPYNGNYVFYTYLKNVEDL